MKMENAFRASTPNMSVRRFSIEGNLAAGKSTLLQVLDMMDEECEIAPEPVTQWQHVIDTDATSEEAVDASSVKDEDELNILKQYYKNP
jgi:deoxycitidine kinase